MPGPSSRKELLDELERAQQRFEAVLDECGDGIGQLICVDDWTVRDLLAVRLWWVRSTGDWIEAGLRGARPDLPARGYGWRDTPALNASVVRRASRRGLPSLRRDLRAAIARVRELVDGLADRQLLRTDSFEWAGSWPVARWVAVNLSRGLTTARSLVLKAARAQ